MWIHQLKRVISIVFPIDRRGAEVKEEKEISNTIDDDNLLVTQ